jgi:UDP-N-acetylenolpyruvoylglucosamine reductase
VESRRGYTTANLKKDPALLMGIIKKIHHTSAHEDEHEIQEDILRIREERSAMAQTTTQSLESFAQDFKNATKRLVAAGAPPDDD